MLALEGMPAFYIHSLLATSNDYERYARTGRKRSINRRQWHRDEIEQILADSNSPNARIHKRLIDIIKMRKQQPAFHPNATQFTLHLGDQLFGFWRQSIDRSQSIFSVSNISKQAQTLSLADINLISTQGWHDLLSGQAFDTLDEKVVLAPYQSVWISNK